MKKALEVKMEKLAKMFPQLWMQDGENFSPSHKNTIWTGEGSDIDGDWAFCSYGYSATMGVHPVLALTLSRLGLYAEFHDGGTVFFYPN